MCCKGRGNPNQKATGSNPTTEEAIFHAPFIRTKVIRQEKSACDSCKCSNYANCVEMGFCR